MPTAKVQPTMYEFIKARKEPFNAIEVDGKILKMGKKTNAFTTHDKGLAEAINARYGWGQRGSTNGLIMNRVDTEHKDRRVKLFSVPKMPWKKED